MSDYISLTREDICRVIEGRGNANRIPILFHFWLHAETFSAEANEVRKIMDQYPDDVQVIPFRIPDVYIAPDDDPSYRWSCMDKPNNSAALDNSGFIAEWETQLEDFLADFPSPEYPALIPDAPADDGRYRLGMYVVVFLLRALLVRPRDGKRADRLLSVSI